MSQKIVSASCFSPDTCEFLSLLAKHEVCYLIVGGEAVIYYGHTRLTGDIDLFYNSMEDNAIRLFAALTEFWQGKIPGIQRFEELLEEGLILQFGVPPNRIDLINRIAGVSFADAWAAREDVTMKQAGTAATIHFIGLDDLIRNKKAAARNKDLDDLDYLRRAGQQR